jgi:Spy/CpxP family protein refolding chaperone
MRQQFVKIITAAALAAGMALAQAAAPGPAPNPPAAQRHFASQCFGRLSRKLNLTDAQKQQAEAIFRDARMTAKPVREQVRANRQALLAAAKAGNSESRIQQIASQQGELLGQMVAIRMQAYSHFCQLLTPEQRTLAAQMYHNWRQRIESRWRARSNG